MADPRESDQRLNLLRRRWEDDKSSLAFLPLAEEYRRLGRLGEALSVLEAGLAANPSYRSAHVALGRCRLELGDVNGAIEAFEQVLGQDPTQLVANKLLVDAYLRADRPAEARDRLDLYSLLNERDPEIPALRHRIAAAIATQSRVVSAVPVVPVAPAAPPSSPAPAAASAPLAAAGRAEPADDTLDETSPAAPPAEEPASWAPVAPIPPAAASVGEVFALPPLPARALGGSPWLTPRVAEGGEPFAGLVAARDRGRYLRGLAIGGVFGLTSASVAGAVAPPPVSPPPTSPLPAAPMPAAPLPSPPVRAALAEPTRLEVAPVVTAPPPVVPESIASSVETPAAPFLEPEPTLPPVAFAPPVEVEPLPEPIFAEPEAAAPPIAEARTPAAAEPRPAEPALTATLGELYLRQGHLGEAEDIFRRILAAEPGNLAALAGLEEARNRRRAAQAAGGPSGVSARKAAVLRDYLERMRRGASRHVS